MPVGHSAEQWVGNHPIGSNLHATVLVCLRTRCVCVRVRVSECVYAWVGVCVRACVRACASISVPVVRASA